MNVLPIRISYDSLYHTLFINTFMDSAVGTNYLSNLESQRFFSYVVLYKFYIKLSVTFMSMIHLKLIIVYDVG